MPNFHEPKIVESRDARVPGHSFGVREAEASFGLPMWKVDEISGVQEGFYAKALHVDRPSGRQCQWRMLDLIVSALWPRGIDIQITHKTGGNLTAEDMRMKIWFAAADNDRVSRRRLMSALGKKGAAARMLKLGKRERKKIARNASKVAAIKRSKRPAAQAQTQSGEVT